MLHTAELCGRGSAADTTTQGSFRRALRPGRPVLLGSPGSTSPPRQQRASWVGASAVFPEAQGCSAVSGALWLLCFAIIRCLLFLPLSFPSLLLPSFLPLVKTGSHHTAPIGLQLVILLLSFLGVLGVFFFYCIMVTVLLWYGDSEMSLMMKFLRNLEAEEQDFPLSSP